VRNKIHVLLSNYNADRDDLFTQAGLRYVRSVKVSSSDRFVLDELWEQWVYHSWQLDAVERRLAEFSQTAPAHEAEARAVLDSIPGGVR
jgi:hypothetical protein